MTNIIKGWDSRWGAAGSFNKWLNLKMTQAKLKPETAFAYLHKVKRKQYIVNAESIVSVIADAGRKPEYAQAIYDLILANEKRGRPLRDVIEQMGAKLVATGFFEKDPKSRIENFPIH